MTGADIHKTRYRTDVLDFNKRYRSATGHYHVYERGVPDIVLQHEKCIRHSVKVPGKCPLSGMDISPWSTKKKFVQKRMMKKDYMQLYLGVEGREYMTPR